MTTNYCVSRFSNSCGVRSKTDRSIPSVFSLLNARNSTGHRTKQSASTPWLRWLRRNNSRSARSTQTRTSQNSFAVSHRSTRPSWAGQASRHCNSSACLPTSANRRSSSSSPPDPQATPTDSTFFPSPQHRVFELTFCASRFSIKGTHIVPRTYVTSRDPLVAADIQRREERCRRSGGIGTAVVLIQCGAVSQVMPVEVDAPAKISWDERNDWADVLARFVDSGRSDFKPISTTARG